MQGTSSSGSRQRTDAASFAGGLVLVWVALGFGNSLQPISTFTWFTPVILLLAYESVWELSTSRAAAVSGHVALIVVQALGLTFGLSGLLSYPRLTFESFMLTFGFGLALGSSTTLGALLPARFLRDVAATSLAPPATCPAPAGLRALAVRLVHSIPLYAFPCLHTATLMITGRILGRMHDPAVSVLDWAPVLQLSGLFGLWGIDFVMDLIGSAIIVETVMRRQRLDGSNSNTTSSNTAVDDDDDGHNNRSSSSAARSGPWRSAQAAVLRTQLGSAMGVLLLLALVCGGLVHGGAFYQKDIVVQSARTQRLRASCVIGQDFTYGTAQFDWMLKRTEDRIAAGDHFVLWAEGAVEVANDDQEAELLSQAKQLLATHGSQAEGGGGNGTYLGLCYTRSGLSHGKAYNLFVLLAPDGTEAWRYHKAFPVPVVESFVVAGPARLPIVDTPYGRVGGAICFDLDHPSYIHSAGAKGVQLLLQPSWTWGSIGPRHFASDVARAVENGLTLFRCSSTGVSGAVSPRGLVWHQVYTGAQQVLDFELPLEPRIRTFYNLAGWLLEWFNLGAALCLWVACLVPGSYLRQALHGTAAAGQGQAQGLGNNYEYVAL